MYFEHNIEIFQRFEPVILEHHECCLVGTMGTGKTDVSIEFIKKYNLNTLVILPTVDLCNQWKEIADKNDIYTLSTITYHTFSRAFAVLAAGFDCYIFDEAHHMDSPVWGKAIRKFREMIDGDKYIIGLTGDPIRYFDSCKNVVDTVFHGHVAYGLTQYEAIMNGILPDVIYVCAIYGTKELYDEYYPKATTKQLKGKLNFVYENCKKINDILLNHALEHAKGFVFVDKIKSIPIGMDIISEAFPDATIRSAHSSMTKSERYNNIEAFKKDDSGFMVAVDIFNEGHHVSGVNTIIMLRKTGSPTIYAQQIGRGLSANYTGSTIIYDFVANKESMKNVGERISIITSMIGAELNKKSKKKSRSGRNGKPSKQIIVHDYSKDFLEVLEEIDAAYSKVAWSEKEDQFLKDNYNTKGVDVCVKELGRTRVSCQKRARRLGLVKPKADWTEAEDNILREYYPTMGRRVASKLPGRSERACTARANHYLGLISRNDGEWSVTEIKFLKKQYEIDGDDVQIPNRTNKECIEKLEELKLLKHDNKRWTEYEDSILIEFYPSIGEECFTMIQTKSIAACKSRVKRLNLTRCNHKWTEQEDQIIRDKYPLFGDKLSEFLPHRSSTSIKARASILGVKKSCYAKSKRSSNNTRSNKAKQSNWTSYEDQIIIDKYPVLGGKIVDLLPNRTYGAIAKRAERLGISRYKNNKSNNDKGCNNDQ